MKRKGLTFPLMAGMIAFSSCAVNQGTEKEEQKLDITNLDNSFKPQTDFYEFATGGWQKRNPLKPEFARYGAFDQLRENNKEQLKTLIEEIASSDNEPGSLAYKIAAVYNAGLDKASMNENGVKDLKPYLDMIANSNNMSEVSKTIGELHKTGTMPFLYLYIDADPMNSDMNLLQTYQAGMTLGDKDYYESQEESVKAIREGYVKYISKVFEIYGYDKSQADKIAANILKLETQLASGAFSQVELRDPVANYNKLSIADFQKKFSSLDWKTIFETNGIGEQDFINASQIPYIENLDKVLSKISSQEIKDYMTFLVIANNSSYIGDEYYNASFEFFDKLMSGKEAQEAQWKRALGVTNGILGEAVGELYVERFFPAEAKERMLNLVSNLQLSLKNRISNLEWMSDVTKEKALDKLAAFSVKIGYPDKWRDYSTLDIKGDMSYMSMILSSCKFDWDYSLSKLGKEVDKADWHMTPQTVNAYYNPLSNEICFPAAILQPPFFYLNGDDAINYGAIGVVIGHEMTHGFDDQGRQFDKNGNITDWWEAEDARKFNEKAAVLISQFDSVEVLPGTNANGRFTLGENIADQGGLLIAYDALMNHLKSNNVCVTYDSFSDIQRFFLSYANVWAGNIRDEEILRLTKIDPHSLGRWRVNATLPNIDAFYSAFDVKENDNMYKAPLDRVVIW